MEIKLYTKDETSDIRLEKVIGIREKGSKNDLKLGRVVWVDEGDDETEELQNNIKLVAVETTLTVPLEKVRAGGSTIGKWALKDRNGNLWEVWRLKGYPFQVISSVTLRIVDNQGDTVVLPFDTSVRDQLSHLVQSGMVLCTGCRLSNPCGIAYDAVLLRTTFANVFGRCDVVTSVTFDNEESLVQQAHSNAISELEKSEGALSTKRGPYEELEELVLWPSLFRTAFQSFKNLSPPRGILLHGPPGTGKTTAVQRVLKKLEKITSCEFLVLHSGKKNQSLTSVGSTERRLREIFHNAHRFVEKHGIQSRCIIFLDELDGLCPKRDEKGISESRVVAQLLTLMDGLSPQDDRVVVVGATNLPDTIDPALRRPGRFEKEILFRPPTVEERMEIVSGEVFRLTGKLLDQSALEKFARSCVGCVGADLVSIVDTAVFIANGFPSLMDLERGKDKVGIASILRKWGKQNHSSDPGKNINVGGYDNVKIELARAVEWPITHKAAMERMKLSPPRGILMFGPPGCSKTTLARRTAQVTGYSFFMLSAADVYSPYVGDAEKTVREVFANARLALPAIVFIDEVEALVGKRGMTNDESGGSASSVQSRVLSTLLNEMDGVMSSAGLLILGATNRVDMIDEALLRPGRFDRVIEVPLPSLKDRRAILDIHLGKMPISQSTTKAYVVEFLAERTDGKSGAELENICREAAMSALRLGQDAISLDSFDLQV